MYASVQPELAPEQRQDVRRDGVAACSSQGSASAWVSPVSLFAFVVDGDGGGSGGGVAATVGAAVVVVAVAVDGGGVGAVVVAVV